MFGCFLLDIAGITLAPMSLYQKSAPLVMSSLKFVGLFLSDRLDCENGCCRSFDFKSFIGIISVDGSVNLSHNILIVLTCK